MSFDLQPTLSGTLVRVRPLRPEDHDDLFAVASDPLIWEQHPVKTRCEPQGFKDFFAESLASEGALLVTDAEMGGVIGSSRYHDYKEDESEIEIGWSFLARSHWGGPYNRDLKNVMLKHAFQFVDSVLFLVGPDNRRSQRAVEKIGGVLETPPNIDPLTYRVRSVNFENS